MNRSITPAVAGEETGGPSPARIFSPAFLRLCAVALGGTASVQLLSAGLPLYVLDLGADEVVLGAMVGLIALTSLAARPWVGWWVDRGGGAWALLVGVGLYATAALGYWLAASVPGVLAFRALTGLAIAVFITSGQSLAVALAPPRQRGEAFGFYSVSLTLAQVLGPPAGVALARRSGYAWLFAASAAVALLAAALAWPMRALRRGPEGPGRRYTLHRALMGPGLLMLLMMVPFGANVGLLPAHAARRGLENPGLVFTAHALGILLAQVTSGRISDRVGRIPVILPGLVLGMLGMWTTALADGWMLVLAAGLSGLALGIGSPALYALAADLIPPREQGSAMATMGIFLEIGIAFGAIGGGFAGRMLGLPAMFGLAGVAPACGAALAAALAVRRHRT